MMFVETYKGEKFQGRKFVDPVIFITSFFMCFFFYSICVRVFIVITVPFKIMNKKNRKFPFNIIL